MNLIFKKICLLSVLLFGLTGCSSNFINENNETSKEKSCVSYLDSQGVFGMGYTGYMNQKFYDKGQVSISDDFIYTVDGNTHLAYYQTRDLGSTSFFFKDGSVINEADPLELDSMKSLFAKLKLTKPKWFKIEGSKISSTTENDPVLGNYLSLIEKHNTTSVKNNIYTYTSWEDKKYKILAVTCIVGKPVKVITRYGEIIDKKAVDTIKTDYLIKYNNPTLEIPTKQVLNYTWLLDTKEGRYFIGKPITEVAFSFVMDFINMVAPNKRLDDKVFSEYKNYIIESINNEPEMNKIVLSQSGENLQGVIPLDGLVYYYCIILDRDTGKGKLLDNKCSF